MPPESVPWDRKDFFKERKHERSDSAGSLGRWRESSYYGSREFNRWGSADRRRPPCHGKQDGWHFFSEESGHGYEPTRSSVDRMLEDESFRPVSRGEGKYRRSERESRGSSSQRDWRGHPWETDCSNTNSSGTSHNNVNSDHRVADDAIPYSYHPQSNFVNTWDQIHLKDQRAKIGGVNDLGITQKCERERSLGSVWKPLKWTRNGSLSSWGSGLSHLSDSKSIEAIDLSERKSEALPKYVKPVRSLSGDAVACVTSALSSEDEISKKKPRLGWGEGLAKYEKKKVEEPDICMNKYEYVFSSNVETTHSIVSSLAEKSPRLLGLSGCASPATPSSVACSSSAGLEEKSFSLTVNVQNETSNLCGSPSPVSMTLLQRLSNSLDKLEIKSISNMGTLLNELLHSDDQNSVESSCMAMNKLLVCRNEISKALEITESEIDLLENELKSLKSENGHSDLHAATSSSLPLEVLENNSKQFIVSSLIPEPVPLKIACGKDLEVEKMSICNGSSEEVLDMKNKDIDSPGTVTSKCFEPCSSVEAVPLLGDNLGKNILFLGDLDSTEASKIKMILTPTSTETNDPVFSNGDCSVPDLVNNETGAAVDGKAFCDLLLTFNKKCASEASEVFNELLPRNLCTSNIWDNVVSCSRGDQLVEEKFLQRKRFQRFKDRVLAVKFKVLKHLWKKDLHLLSTRKSRVKSLRKTESSLHVTHGVNQKNGSFIHSRFSSSDYLSLISVGDIINHTSKLLTDFPVMPQRNILKMPALILDEKEKYRSKLISGNGLVEDPCTVEKERAMINPWTSEEKQIFMDHLAIYGKDFRKIASLISHKTTADCIEFYYKNHKSDSFKKRNKKLDFNMQAKSHTNSYLMTTGKKWNREMCASSLDILGAASMIASHGDRNVRDQLRFSGKSGFGKYVESNIGKGNDDITENTSSIEFIGNERETAAADVLAGICGSLSSEAMSSCVTRQPLLPNSDHDVDDDTCSDEDCEEMDPSDWTDEEKSSFVLAVSSYGRDFVQVSRCVGTRSRDQCKVFFSKARKCLGLDLVRLPGNHGTSGSDGANGGGSESEDGCILDTGTTICYNKLSSKLTKDVPLDVNLKHEKSVDAEIHNLENMNMSKEKSAVLLMICNGTDVDVVLSSDPPEKNGSHFYSIDANMNDTVSRQADLGSDSLSIGGENYECHLNADAITCEKSVVKGSELGPDDKKSNLHKGSQNDLQCLVEDFGETVSHLAADQSSSTHDREFPLQAPLEFDSAERPCTISFTHEGSSAVANSSSESAITKENRLSSTHYLYKKADHVECKHGNLQLTNESSHSHAGYRVEGGQNGDSQNLAEGSCLRKCSSVKPHCLGSEFPLLSPKIDQKSYHAKTSSSDSEIPCKHADVKLFGKILTHPSSMQKSSCSSNENEQKSQFNELSKKSSNANTMDVKMGTLKFDVDEEDMGLKNVPSRNFGFWDGNRIQTGFASLSDPAVVLAKYPTAFGSYSMSFTKIEKQPFQALSSSNSNGVSIFPMDGGKSRGMVDYHQFQSQGLLADMQRGKGFEAIPFPSLQQQRRGFMGMNAVGRGGIVVGDPGNGISDPVAAIKMHYAKAAEQIGGQSGSLTREDDVLERLD